MNESAHSFLSDEDIDWDKTEEDLDAPCRRRRSKRPSAPPIEDLNETPPKRHKPVKTVVKSHFLCMVQLCSNILHYFSNNFM